MMRKLFVFMLTAILITSCSSKKILSVNKIAQNGIINNIASQYDFSQNRFSTFNNSKNSYVKNLPEVEVNIPTVKNNQDFLASKDKVEPSVLINNYSYNSPQIIQNERINKSFNEKPQIFENEKSSAKKSKIKDKKNKILWIIVSVISIGLGIFMLLYSALLFVFQEPFGGVVILLTSILFAFITYFSIRKVNESNSKQEYKKDRDGRNKEKNKSLKYALTTTLIFLLIALIFAAS